MENQVLQASNHIKYVSKKNHSQLKYLIISKIMVLPTVTYLASKISYETLM